MKKLVDEEVATLQKSLKTDEVAECWEAHKVRILELGFDAIQDFKRSVDSESVIIKTKLDQITLEISSSGYQLVSYLSANYSSLRLARSTVSTYVSLELLGLQQIVVELLI